uniref:NACHT domain-containing protein n=1 Tax=Oreochromis aureus TaxID=47969 RepID=A0A668RZT6_OREAU
MERDTIQSREGRRPVSPAESYASMNSEMSKGEVPNFSDEVLSSLELQRPVSTRKSSVPMDSGMPKGELVNFSNEVLSLLEGQRPESSAENTVNSDMSKAKPQLFSNNQPSEQKTDSSATKSTESNSEDPPGSKNTAASSSTNREKDAVKKMKEILKKELNEKYKEQSKEEIDTELCVQKEEKKVQPDYKDMFNVRTVLTTGMAGVGKTFQTKMFTIKWAKGKANKEIDLIVSFQFSELNERGDQVQSMEELLNDYFSEIKPQGHLSYDKFKILFILDGLEECELPLDFKNNKILTDMKAQASMDELLTNLIKGTLLPSAHLWIISQPSGVDKIPTRYIQKVTKCQETSKRWTKLVTHLRNRLREMPLVKNNNHTHQKNTEHIIREDNTAEGTDELKKKQTVEKLKTTSEIFNEKKGEKIRTVLTVGEAGIGKSFHVQKYIKEWADNTSPSLLTRLKTSVFGKGKDNELGIFPLEVSELNQMKDKISLVGLLNHCFKETKDFVITEISNFPVCFILDGLDQFQLPLNFDNNNILTDISEPASVDVLLTNLIKGNLLPSALVWITSRPSADNWQNDEKCVDRVTEIREKSVEDKLKENLKMAICTDYKEKSDEETDTELCVQKEEKEELVQPDYKDMFNVRTVLTTGIAGVGKTFQSRMFMFNWAKEKTNKNIDFIVAFQFSKLNERKVKNQSMEELLNDYFSTFKKQGHLSYDKFKILFILDGLEKCTLPLDFKNNTDLTDMEAQATMDELLTNLIKGTLLPSAHLWIISQPSGVDKIPSDYIQKVTKCQETSKRWTKLVTHLCTRLREMPLIEDADHPNQKNTEHIIREDSTAEGTDEQKKKQTVEKLKTTSEIFNEKKGEKIRTVLTVGEADIGKSFHVQKYIKEWADNKQRVEENKNASSSQKKKDELGIFPLKVSELNQMKAKEISLVGLLNHCLKETKDFVITEFSHFPVCFILDGLDQFQLLLDFDNNTTLTDISEPASVDVLLTNLIKGNLLPSALVWITSRPSADNWLNDEKLVYRRTEIREKPEITSQRKLKSQLKEQFTRVSEGIDRQQTSAVLNEIYTELYIIEGQSGEVNEQQEIRQVQNAKFKPVKQETAIKYNEIFTSVENKHIKTVMTIGVAGIGKTIASMKYMLDWAEGNAVQNIFFMFPLPFRELNLRREEQLSFENLLHQFFPAMKTSEISDYDNYKILVVLDGFDECRLDLDFSESNKCIDVREQTSVNILLTNLIQGNLLPEAQIWITSRPAASNRIPADKVARVTEVRGFNEEQKEEYFRKRFNEDLSEKILTHVKKSRSLYIMCHIPVFCWITAKVLEEYVTTNQEDEMPKTLTDMYTYFLLIECRQANRKYNEDKTSESCEIDKCWNERNKETIISLGKLAFEELVKGNFLFTEENLTECGTDITKAAVFSGILTQIEREGPSMYPQKLFCFVHLSIQEFLAAFYVFYIFNNKSENLLTTPPSVVSHLPASDFYKKAVDKALDSKHGDWDMFLRFLLGLSLETNQKHLKELLIDNKKNNKVTNKETAEYIKKKINEDISDAEKNLNLFYCLNELNDHSLVKDIKEQLRSGKQNFEDYSAAQWSALTFVLLTSDEKLDVFDLKKYRKSEKVLLGMLPVVKVSKRTLLSWCDLTEQSCSGLTDLVLSSAFSNLSELDMSHNDLLDLGVEHLAEGLKSPHCKLKILKLSGCQVTETGCSFLALSLESNTASLLEHLDLRYNHPGDNGTKRLMDKVREESYPNRKLKTVLLDHGGAHRLKPGFKKYGVELKFDENTAGKRLLLEGDRKVRTVKKVEEKPARTENENRFKRSQVFCVEGLEDLCYWEVEWSGTVCIAAAYKRVGRKWDSSGGLGCNEMSWGLHCSGTDYTAMHGKFRKRLRLPSSKKIAVLLDWRGGTLSYYSVSSEKLSLIHTFHAKFTEPLFPGFWFKTGSVTLCDID